MITDALTDFVIYSWWNGFDTWTNDVISGFRYIFQGGAGQGEYLYEVITVSEENGIFAISADERSVSTSITLPEDIRVPVEKGDILGVTFEQKPLIKSEYDPRWVRVVEKFYE